MNKDIGAKKRQFKIISAKIFGKTLKNKMPQEWGTFLKRKPTKHTLFKDFCYAGSVLLLLKALMM